MLVSCLLASKSMNGKAWSVKTRPPYFEVFRGMRYVKQGKRITLAIFVAPPRPQKCLLGLLPKPATSGQNVQK